MIGYYVHHVGLGHLHRALAVVRHLPGPVTVLSSRDVDGRWPGPWVRLPRDDAAASPADPTAGGTLHWVPRHDDGLRDRMALVARWIEANRPDVMVVDLSVEIVLLARLMGVPVVTVSLPGVRDDRAHRLGHEVADAIVAPWPGRFPELGPSLRPFASKVHYAGAISRFEGRVPRSPVPDRAAGAGASPKVLALAGTGGAGTPGRAVPAGPGTWSSIGPGAWNPDPWAEIEAADVVVTHAGLGALADVATARRPAVVVPEIRPHAEQVTTAAVLAEAGLATVVTELPGDRQSLARVIDDALRRRGENWEAWADGAGGRRMADVVQQVARRSG